MQRVTWLRFNARAFPNSEETFHVFIRTDQVTCVADGSEEGWTYIYVGNELKWEVEGTSENVTGAIAKSMSSPLVSP